MSSRELPAIDPRAPIWAAKLAASSLATCHAPAVHTGTSSNISLSKEDKAVVALMCDMFKIFEVVLQMTILVVEIFTQLQAHNQVWMWKALLMEALPVWHGLESSTLDVAEQDCFFTAMKYAVYKNQVQKPQWHDKKAPGKQQHQSLKGKWPKMASSNSSTSSGLGVGNSALHH